MSSVRERLGITCKTKTQYVKQTYYEASGSELVKRENVGSNFIQLDVKLFREITKEFTKAETEMALFMLDQIDYRTNCFDYTAKEIFETLGFDLKTVEKGFAKFKSTDFIRKVKRSSWMVNPAVAIQCDRSFITHLMDDYNCLPYTPPKTREKDGVEENVT